MDSSKKTLQDIIQKAQREIRELLVEVRDRSLDKGKLEAKMDSGLRGLDDHLKSIDIHIGHWFAK
jgi:signal transduction histidine kinase